LRISADFLLNRDVEIYTDKGTSMASSLRKPRLGEVLVDCVAARTAYEQVDKKQFHEHLGSGQLSRILGRSKPGELQSSARILESNITIFAKACGVEPDTLIIEASQTLTFKPPVEAVPLADWNILRPELTDGVAELRLHQPRPGNVPNTFYIDVTLRLGEGEYEYEGRTVFIGLKNAFLYFESPCYQITKGSMIGARAEHPNFDVDVGGTKIKGPRNSDGWLVGDPLGEEHVAVIEPAGGGEEIVTLSLHAGRLALAFKVAPVGDEDKPTEIDLTTNKQAVLNTFISQVLGRDRQGRAILARTRMQRRPRT
jgi:hypothetical protein